MHIVIFTGGEQPPKQEALPYLAQCDYCIAADSGLIACEDFGFTPNLILGDFDSLQELDCSVEIERLQKYPKEIIQAWDCEKDYSDTELAVVSAYEYANSKGIKNPKISLVGGAGGRADHFLANVALFEKPQHPHVWLCANQVVFSLDSTLEYNKSILLHDAKKTDTISVFAVQPYAFNSLPQSKDNQAKEMQSTDEAQLLEDNYKIESEGLMWSLDTVEWLKGSFSLSNRISDEYFEKNKPIKLNAVCGKFLVFCPL